MTFDAATLTIAGALVAFASGVFLLIHWWQSRQDWAALSWGAASCGMGIGLAMLALRGVLPDAIATVLGPLILNVCAVGMWAAARIFNRGSIAWRPLIVAVGAGISILVLMSATGADRLATALGSAISASLYAAGAVAFWLARGERLHGRWAMICLLCTEAIALFLLTIELSISQLFSVMPAVNGFGIIHFVGLVYAGGSAISLITMLKDRSESKHRAAALIDPLTGLANRRAFMNYAQSILDRNMREDNPISLLAFDIDKFKRINDTFGHPTGDRVLRIFGDVLSTAARPADIAGRIGGEEFAMALPGCGIDAALAVAARIRAAFQNDAHFVDGQTVEATVSVGVAAPSRKERTLAEIIASADGALYRAKKLGRNRVVLAAPESPDPKTDNVIRIA